MAVALVLTGMVPYTDLQTAEDGTALSTAFVSRGMPARPTLLVSIGWSVGELIAELGLSQPGPSEHLRVLREAGARPRAGRGPAALVRLEPGPLAEVDAWLAPYRWMWADRLDALAGHLDTAHDPGEAP